MSIAWSEGRWIAPAAGTFGVLALFIAWQYFRARALPPWVRWTAAALKLLGFALLLLFLLGPQIVRLVATPGTNWVALVADDSASMRIADQAGDATRGSVMHAAADRPEWRRKLGEQYQTRDFTFAARTRRVGNFDGLAFDGTQSAMVDAIDRVARQFEGQPLAAMIVFTDGAATDFERTLPSNVPPVYPVLIAPDKELADASIERATAIATVFENAPVTVDADVRCVGAKGRSVNVRLLDEKGATVAEQHKAPASGDETIPFRFLTTPAKPGPAAYRVQAVLPGDVVPQNDQRFVVANRDQGPYRVLYAAGQPSWESKFLQRALNDDPEVKLVSLLRVARGQAKFDWHQGGNGNAHPFYQGQVAEDEAERYDEPVFLRLGTRNANELRNGFPRTADELFPYDAVMINYLDAAFFTRDQLTLLREYVADRGGSLMMLGGSDSLDAGKYEGTPLADVLPVYLGARHSHTPAVPVRVSLSRDGMLQPWARLRATESEEQERLDKMPGFLVAHGLDALKPGAQAVATMRDNAGAEYPAIAVQRFGKGVCTAFMIGDWWRWGFRSAEMHADLDKFWRQALRASLADVPRRAAITAGKPLDGTVEIAVTARGPNFHPSERATAKARVRSPDGRWTAVEMQPDATQPGRFVAQAPAKDSGIWLAEAVVTDAADANVAQVQCGWAVNQDAEEFRALRPDPAPLEALAKKTGGRVLKPSELEAFVEELKNKPQPLMESHTEPLWHHAAWLALAICCFVGEWGLRRWKGLA